MAQVESDASTSLELPLTYPEYVAVMEKYESAQVVQFYEQEKVRTMEWAIKRMEMDRAECLERHRCGDDYHDDYDYYDCDPNYDKKYVSRKYAEAMESMQERLPEETREDYLCFRQKSDPSWTHFWDDEGKHVCEQESLWPEFRVTADRGNPAELRKAWEAFLAVRLHNGANTI